MQTLMERIRRRPDLYTAVLLTVTLTTLYFATRTENHDYDSVGLAFVTDNDCYSALCHQNHLLYGWWAWPALKLARFLGYKGLPFAPLAALSSLTAAAAAAWLFLTFRRWGVQFKAALLVTAAASLSAGWWYFAGEPETVSPTTLLFVGTSWGLARPPRRLGGVVALAAWLAFATWFHQSLALTAAPAVVVLGWTREGRWRRLLVFLSVFSVLVLAGYTLAERIIKPVPDVPWPHSLYLWTTYYHWGCGWGYWEDTSPRGGLIQLLTALISPGPQIKSGIYGMSAPLALARLAPAILFFGAIVGVIASGARRLWSSRRVWLIAGLIWFITFQAVFSWWEPYNVEWWIGTLIPLWLLGALAFPPRRGAIAVGAALVAAAAGINLFRMILPSTRPGQDNNETAARVIVETTRPGDIIWIPDGDVEHWVKLLTKCDREIFYTEMSRESERKRRLLHMLADPAGPYPDRDLYLSDGEWGLLPTDESGGEDARLRGAYFTVLYYGEPVAAVRCRGRWLTYIRYRRPPQALGSLAVYDVTETAINEPKLLNGRNAVATFAISVPAEGRYSLALQAQAPQGGDVPVLVAVDGRWVAAPRVNAVTWSFYEFPTDLTVGRHVVTAELAWPGRPGPVLVRRLAVYRSPDNKTVPGDGDGDLSTF